MLGLRTTMVAGLGLFGAGGLGAGVAGTAAEFLAARGVQGLGAALLMPTALASITTAVPDGPRRAAALATWSTVGAVGWRVRHRGRRGAEQDRGLSTYLARCSSPAG